MVSTGSEMIRIRKHLDLIRTHLSAQIYETKYIYIYIIEKKQIKKYLRR